MDVNIQEFVQPVDPEEWWRNMRRQYNMGFMIAGSVAFTIYCLIMFLLVFPQEPHAEISLETVMFLFLVYALMLAFANLLYLLGPVVEKVVDPDDKSAFRKRLYNIECIVSFSLPFLVPLMVLFLYL